MGKKNDNVKIHEGFVTAIVGIMLAIYLFLGISASANKCTTFDEIAHLTAGYSYWKNDDFRLQPENGVFPQYWAAMPLLWGNYKFPSLDQAAWQRAEVFNLGHEFFYLMGNKLDKMLFQGRCMTAILGVLMGLLVFFWSKQLFEWKGGIFSLFLFIFCPAMLAHGNLITSDMALTLGLTASVWAFWNLLHKISYGMLIASLAGFCLLFLSKMSAILILPMLAILLWIRFRNHSPLVCEGISKSFTSKKEQGFIFAGIAILHAVFVWLAIWAAYHFRYAASKMKLPFFTDWDYVLQNENLSEYFVKFLRSIQALPEAFLYGFAFVLRYAENRGAFLNGESYVGGKWEFFPYAFLYKTPIPFLILIGTGIAAWFYFRKNDELRGKLYSFFPMLVLTGVYGITCIFSSLNLGHRHLLPIYPALYILAGINIFWISSQTQKMKLFIYGLLLWFAVESFYIRPHYLAYFNQIAGGPLTGYQHLVDSSLDWGQDLPGLKKWLDKNARSQNVYLSYFGTGNPEYYGIKSTRLPGFFDKKTSSMYSMNTGIYCISATMLQSIYTPFFGAWNESYERSYREALEDFKSYDATAEDLSARQKLVSEKGEAFWQNRWQVFEQIRFARLCSFLRYKEPDAQIGYSILIYRLGEKDLQRALYDAPFEGFYQIIKKKD